jgi:hypothetical protein
MPPDVTRYSEFESGTVYEFREQAVYVPTGVAEQVSVDAEDEVDAVLAADAVHRETPPGVVLFETAGRDATERAELWAAIHDAIDLDEPLEWREPTAETCGRTRVPAVVAADGTAAMATFLATSGFENGEIADGLDVGTRTVSQYISDFQKGER